MLGQSRTGAVARAALRLQFNVWLNNWDLLALPTPVIECIEHLAGFDDEWKHGVCSGSG